MDIANRCMWWLRCTPTQRWSETEALRSLRSDSMCDTEIVDQRRSSMPDEASASLVVQYYFELLIKMRMNK